MIIYLSLRQILLNQIAVLIRKQSDKSNDDPERLLRRLNYLQQALEQIKSYQHNSNYQYVIKHFNIDLTDEEERNIHDFSRRYDDTGDASKREKSGFTTQRSETLFTGAAEEQYPKFYGSDPEDDEKHSHSKKKAPRWITYRGFAHWLRKQSFIKFKKRNDQDKYRKIWNTILGLKLMDQWDKRRIKKDNIIGCNGSAPPYIAIHKCGSKEIVKASLLRLSVTQNRIFKFNIDESELNARTFNTRARGSIDLDNEDIDASQSYNNAMNANQLIQGRNLFDEVQNKDVMRIVATMLWDTNLANNVLEELLHNPRFSMYGIHAKNLADRIAKEMNLGKMASYEAEKSPSASADAQQQPQQIQKNTASVEQFAIPTSSRKPQANYAKTENKGRIYNAQYDAQQNNYNNDAQQKKQSQNYKHNEPQSVAEEDAHQYTSSPSITPNIISPDIEAVKPHHRPQSASVVMHDNIRDSEIHDYGAHNDYDSDQHNEYGDDEDESESPDAQHNAPVNDNIGFGRRKSVDDAPKNEEPKIDVNTFENTYDNDVIHENEVLQNPENHKETEKTHESTTDSTTNTAESKQNVDNKSDTYVPAGIRRRKTVDKRTSFLKQDFMNLAEIQKWNKLCERLNAVFDSKVSVIFKAYADAEEFDFQAILDDIEEYPDDRDCFDSNLLLYMSDKFDWDKKELDKFYRIIKRVLMDKKSTRRQESLARLLSFGPSTFDVIHDIDTDDEKMDLNRFNQKWGSGLIEVLRQYCIQEEYDLDSIAEDLESFEEDCCMIVEELNKQFAWKGTQKANAFVNDLREFISADPQQVTKHLTSAYFEDD